MRLKVLNAVILAAFFGALLISNLFYFWVKIGGSILKITASAEVFLLLAGSVAMIILIVKLVLNPLYRIRQNIYPALAVVVTFLIVWLFNLHTTEESFQSNVKTRACRQTDLFTARFFLRENKTFEDIRTGPAGSLQYSTGTWELNGDTIKLTYTRGNNAALGSSLIVQNEKLKTIRGGEIFPTGYSVGFCED